MWNEQGKLCQVCGGTYGNLALHGEGEEDDEVED